MIKKSDELKAGQRPLTKTLFLTGGERGKGAL
ncbi:hypothetical protein X925_00360 [Petrotoga sp. 9T1HF07.CasAA.8.2]|nr:hypothetical protein X925_00360 [Petrotoga sp. 9T1HF07.CasAA.8.2]